MMLRLGRAMSKRFLMSPGRSAPYSRTSISGYPDRRPKTMRKAESRMTFSQKNAFSKRRSPAGSPRDTSASCCSFQSPSIASGRPSSLFKFPLDQRTLRSAERTAAMASLVEVLPTLPVTPTMPGRKRQMMSRASCRKRADRMVMASCFISFLEPIGGDIVIIEGELGEVPESGHHRRARERRSGRFVQFE